MNILNFIDAPFFYIMILNQYDILSQTKPRDKITFFVFGRLQKIIKMNSFFQTRGRFLQTSSVSSRDTYFNQTKLNQTDGFNSAQFDKRKRNKLREQEKLRIDNYKKEIKGIINSCDLEKSTNDSKLHTNTSLTSMKQTKYGSLIDLNIGKLANSLNNSQLLDKQMVQSERKEEQKLKEKPSIDFEIVDTFNQLLIQKMNQKELDISHEQEMRSRYLMRHLTQSVQMKTKPVQQIQINPNIFQSSLITTRKGPKLNSPCAEPDKKSHAQNDKSMFSFNQLKRQTVKWVTEPKIYLNFFRKLSYQVQLKRTQEEKSKQIQFKDLEEYLMQNYQLILKSIHIRNNQEIFTIFGKIFEICQDLLASNYFTRFIIVLGDFFNDAHDLNKSSFFLKQAYLCATFLHQYKEKAIILLLLAKICDRLKQFESSIQFLKKAMEFSWLLDDEDLELKIYEQLGIAYFYLGQTEQAIFFHEKFTNGISEPANTIIRLNSQILIKRYEEPKQPEINGFILHRLSLPIVNKFELIDGKNPFCDQFKSVNYKKANVKTTIKFLLEEQEFQAYDLDITVLEKPIDYFESRHYQYFKLIGQGDASTFEELDKKIPLFGKRNPNLFLYHGNAPHTWVPQEIIAIKQKYLQLQRKYNENEFSENRTDLKLSIEKRIRLRQLD